MTVFCSTVSSILSPVMFHACFLKKVNAYYMHFGVMADDTVQGVVYFQCDTNILHSIINKIQIGEEGLPTFWTRKEPPLPHWR